MNTREAAKSALQKVGLLAPVRVVLRKLLRKLWSVRRSRYYSLVIMQYRSPFARLMESYAAYERREREASRQAARSRFEADQAAISEARAKLGNDRRALAHAILDQVIDVRLAPRFYDYDYLDDIVGIIGGRYCSDDGCGTEESSLILNALSALVGLDGPGEWEGLADGLRLLLGRDHGYVPARGDVTHHVRKVIPEMADEFIALKAESDVERFLEINREYSRRQAHGLGVWDVRDLSLLRGYERDHHLLLRTLIGLLDAGYLSSDDEALLIGPRHIDEVVFFRKSLGLRRTIGLDLFEYGKDEIVAGDMHRMSFESNRFRLVFCAGTISYSYNVRRVIDEIARVATRPGYVFLLDAGGRKVGTNALGRSDIPTVDALLGLFHRTRFQVLAKDRGRSLAPDHYDNEPCCAVRLDRGPDPLPGGAQSARYLRASV
jgi:SAM-dependent methyltransferase